MIGLPLRLLAREIYDKVRLRAGDAAVALVTGEEKIIPAQARYWICTVEAMPSDVEVPFLAIDEVQLCADFERGHIFTDRVMNRRGRDETMLLGAGTMRPILEKLLPGTNFVSRPRFSQLLYAGQKKLTRLPPRSAIVAFSADMVYATAELIRRQHGGAAVVRQCGQRDLDLARGHRCRGLDRPASGGLERHQRRHLRGERRDHLGIDLGAVVDDAIGQADALDLGAERTTVDAAVDHHFTQRRVEADQVVRTAELDAESTAFGHDTHRHVIGPAFAIAGDHDRLGLHEGSHPEHR